MKPAISPKQAVRECTASQKGQQVVLPSRRPSQLKVTLAQFTTSDDTCRCSVGHDIRRQIRKHCCAGSNHRVRADFHFVDQIGSEADGREFADMNHASRTGIRSKTREVTEHSVVIYRAVRVKNAEFTNLRSGIHNHSGHDHRTSPDLNALRNLNGRMHDGRKFQMRSFLRDRSDNLRAEVVIANRDDDTFERVLLGEGGDI